MRTFKRVINHSAATKSALVRHTFIYARPSFTIQIHMTHPFLVYIAAYTLHQPKPFPYDRANVLCISCSFRTLVFAPFFRFSWFTSNIRKPTWPIARTIQNIYMCIYHKYRSTLADWWAWPAGCVQIGWRGLKEVDGLNAIIYGFVLGLDIE